MISWKQYRAGSLPPQPAPMFSTSEPKAVKLRHWTKTTRQGTNCAACGQRVPPHAEHECWTLEPMPQERAEREQR